MSLVGQSVSVINAPAQCPPILDWCYCVYSLAFSLFQAHCRMAMIMCAISVVFIATFSPALLMAHSKLRYNVVLYYCYHLSSITNPFIYCFMNRNLLRTFKGFLKRWFLDIHKTFPTWMSRMSTLELSVSWASLKTKWLNMNKLHISSSINNFHGKHVWTKVGRPVFDLHISGKQLPRRSLSICCLQSTYIPPRPQWLCHLMNIMLLSCCVKMSLIQCL